MASWNFVSVLAVICVTICNAEWLPEEVHKCSAGCPSGFFAFEDSCYVIPRVKVSWGQAVGYCRALNSELLTIETNAEQTFLEKELQKHHGDQLWFSATDLVVEGQWRHALTMSPVLFEYWAPGQPDDFKKTKEVIETGENCAVLNRKANFKWTDETCGLKTHFICEKPRVHVIEQHSGKFWFSATDIIVEGQWRWALTMSPVLKQFWAEGELDNKISSDGVNGQHCAAISKKWSDEDCKLRLHFICEKARVHVKEVERRQN